MRACILKLRSKLIFTITAAAALPLFYATESLAQSGAEYPWLSESPRGDCVLLPRAEREKFGCILDQPEPEPSKEAVLDWPWLIAFRPVDCVLLPTAEKEKFESCQVAAPSEGEQALQLEARLLVSSLLQTRDLFQARFDQAKRRRARLSKKAEPLATENQIEALRLAKGQLRRLQVEQGRAELVAALTSTVETMTIPRAELKDERPPLYFSVIRNRADVFASPDPDSPSIATLERGDRVLRIGDEVVKARRLIFSPSTNFVFVGASLVQDEVIETDE